ncbi:MAG: cysteine--tRNA ligase [Thermodesulfobacteriaceae bacterium]|nr:cysteine--tRNA ligase [Thermodesulfobacteriaceae bacterium]
MKASFKIYNSLSKKIEVFEPLNPPKVTMYVCGITAYDSTHLGHIRSALVFDILYRFLKYLGYEVVYVRNVTDIDDKIINRANRENLFWKDLVKKYTQEYHEILEKLNLLKPTYEPFASEHIPEIIEFIQGLIEKGLAYQSDGDVYFEVQKMPSYGKLSGRKIDELLVGVRIEVSEKKRNPLDFALWKSAKPGEPFWESPWGKGRPGWHIECSAMCKKYLGETLDIHGGGLDLVFPHHENEIAQSEALTGKPFARYFIHHGLITVEGEKMSKSLGNFGTMEYLLQHLHPEVIKAFLLSKHYRSPLDYSERVLKEVEKAVYHFYETLYWIKKAIPYKEGLLSEKARKLERQLKKFEEDFILALSEDLNTALALGYVFSLENEAYNFITAYPFLNSEEVLLLERVGDAFQNFSGTLLGFGTLDPVKFWEEERKRKLKQKGKSIKDVENLIFQRQEARKQKKFEIADAIRSELQNWGIFLKDTRTETFWYVE